MRWIAAAGVALLFVVGAGGTASGAELVKVTPDGFLQSDLSYMDSPPNDSRIFLAERGNPETKKASVRILEDGEPVSTPFLTIENVDVSGERGVMSIAFPPDYATSGLFYIFWIAAGPDELNPDAPAGEIRIVEYRRSSDDPNKAEPDYSRLVLNTPHGATNHNGGWMEFGPDGYLYFSIGDNANRNNAQDLQNLFGKIMRIDPADPAGAPTYTIPADNPFTGGANDRKEEIWAYGLRNPYRGAFAPDGRLTIGDVGQGTWEEINAGDLKGRNLGWPACEGFCSPAQGGLTDPVFAYNHDGSDGQGGGCAVIGGDVVEDPSLVGLTGRYIYADYCGGVIRSLDLDVAGGDPVSTGLTGFGNPVAFGTDSSQCSYMLQGNGLFRIVADETGTVACPYEPEPPPLPEVNYFSFIPNRAVIGKKFVVGAKCSISCTATATGKVRISRNRYRKSPTIFTLKPVSRSLAPDIRGNLVFQIPAGRVPKIKQAIRNGSRVTAPVTVTLVGEDSSGGSGSRTTLFVLPKRR